MHITHKKEKKSLCSFAIAPVFHKQPLSFYDDKYAKNNVSVHNNGRTKNINTQEETTAEDPIYELLSKQVCGWLACFYFDF